MGAPYCEEDDARGFHGVLRGKHDPAVVNTAVEIRVWGPANGEVPLKEVILRGEGNVTLSTHYQHVCHETLNPVTL